MARRVFDTNHILRFILQDIEEQADEAERLIDEGLVFVPYEVLAEVAYVMMKVYEISRDVTAQAMKTFTEIDNIWTENSQVTDKAIQLFSETKLDFVDCLLCAYHTELGYQIFTFDKKLKKLIKKEDEE